MKVAAVLSCAVALMLVSASPARAQEVVAVLSSDQRAYRETYESFQASFGKPVPVLALGEKVPRHAKIVVAFGGKAAIQSYAEHVTVIYALTPGFIIDRTTHDGPSVKIMMGPGANGLLRALGALQPALKRLAVLWSHGSRASSMPRLVEMGAARGIGVSLDRLDEADDLPRKLRELKGQADAIWLPPDPILINSRNFEIIKRFSYDNHIPFYAPTEGLAEQGAVGAVSVSYREMGRTMASVANGVLAGSQLPQDVFTERNQVAVNRMAAAEAGLSLPAEALKAADRVFP